MSDLLIERSADIDGNHRFSLSRVWDRRLPIAAWLMLNPSTADDEQDDPTIRRVMHFSRENGCGGAIVVNLWPLRTAYPRDLWPAIACVPAKVLERNEASIFDANRAASLHIVAFGADAGRSHRPHVAKMLGAFRNRSVPVGSAPFRCLGLTDDGWPLHPLARGRFAIPNARKLNGWKLLLHA